MEKLIESALVKQTLDADQYSANANGVAVDTKDYNGAMLACLVGDVDGADADETYEVKVQEADTQTGPFTDVTDASVSIARDGDDQPYTLDIPGVGTTRKRWLRAQLTVGGTTPAIDMGAAILLDKPFNAPVTQDN